MSSSACSHCSLSFSQDPSSAKKLQRHTSSCHYWLHAFYEADGGALLGASERADPSGHLVCFVPGCSFEEANANVLTSHVSNVHCEGDKLSCRVASWDHLDDPGLADLRALAVQGPSRSAEVAAASSSSHAASPAPLSTPFTSLFPTVTPACLSLWQGTQRWPTTLSQTQPSTPEPSPPPPAQRRSHTSRRPAQVPALSVVPAYPKPFKCVIKPRSQRAVSLILDEQ
ncbi:hypothetical protein NLJ89_g10403 [Agrocybe chaxingu]|uniref:Uncharacterized protein n=1 Tax=Agrocybe chaxingu TaxID=84603 RepID=A0A9W8MS62_9AGAR|nr:hypothetical protein NLJ89_g10403 [Agrocybe chaxingu]